VETKERTVPVRLAVVDLVRRVAVVRVADDDRTEFPHMLRGTLAAMLSEPAWHVVVAFEDDETPRQPVAAVLEQAQAWAAERQCRLSVAPLREVPALTSPAVT
jgi:predicted NAD/FAD-dependent oxidoreductase